jgi:hypothetical protein
VYSICGVSVILPNPYSENIVHLLIIYSFVIDVSILISFFAHFRLRFSTASILLPFAQCNYWLRAGRPGFELFQEFFLSPPLVDLLWSPAQTLIQRVEWSSFTKLKRSKRKASPDFTAEVNLA